MKIQLEQINLLRAWPTIALRDGYHAIRVLVRIGDVPIGEVMTRSVRTGQLTPRRLARRISRKLGYAILNVLARDSIAAGPDALAQLSAEARESVRNVNLSAASWRVFGRLVEKHLLLATGLPAPWPELIHRARLRGNAYPTPPVTIIVCTRDRAGQLEGCIRHLLEIDYPEFEILIVDNSADPTATREVCQRIGVTYVREPRAGLSLARNTALAAARNRWVAFTDDDCRPEANWLRELVRKLQDTNCRCVCGLVLPATLDNSAEIAFEIYGGLGRGFTDVAYAPMFLRKKPFNPAETWQIGAGASMLLDAHLALDLGGFDTDLGAGSACPCSEDTLLWYQILRKGHSIHYTPRAIVHHHHRSTPDALRKQIHAYAIGHAAYHVRCFFNYGDHRSLLHLVYHLPKWFWRNYRRAARGNTKYPRSLIPLEARGTVRGAFTYAWVKARRFIRGVFVPGEKHSNASETIEPIRFSAFPAQPPMNQETAADDVIEYEPDAEQKPVRAA